MAKLYKREGSRYWWTWYRGRRRSTGCADRKAAALAVAEWERRDASPAYAASLDTSVGDASDWMMEALRSRGSAEATLDYRERKAGHLLRVLGEHTALASIDAAAVDRYIAQRLAEGAGRHTIAKELGTLRMMLRAAKRRGAYSHDLDAVMPQGFSAGYEPRRRALTPEEVDRLLIACKPHRAAWIAFAIGTAARLSEVRRARRSDVDLDAGLVKLRGTKTKLAPRTVPILPMTRPLIERALIRADGAAPLLFSPWTGVHLSLERACRRAGIAPCSPNDLRRTLATWLRSAGVEASLVAEVMGHADARMVERVYGRLEGARLRDAVLAAVGHSTETDTATFTPAENPEQSAQKSGPTTPIDRRGRAARIAANPAESARGTAFASSAEARVSRAVSTETDTALGRVLRARIRLLRVGAERDVRVAVGLAELTRIALGQTDVPERRRPGLVAARLRELGRAIGGDL